MISAIILTILASLLYFPITKSQTGLEIIQRIEAIPYDIRLKLSTPIRINQLPPIIIIDIDEYSLKTDGRWPWSRIKLAKLIEKLYQNETALIILDVVQSEKESNPVIKIKKALSNINKPLPSWLNKIEKKLDADTYFSNTIKEKELVLGFPFHSTLTTKTGDLRKSTIKSDTSNINLLITRNMLGYTANLNEFSLNSAGSGFINIASDPDGVIRHAPLILSFNKKVYPSLALEAARIYHMEDTVSLHTAAIGNIRTITHINIGNIKIPTDAYGRILIPYLGKQKHFTYLSASKLLHSKKHYPELENAIAIIGTSAITLADLRSTPIQPSFPGVEIQANIMHSLLHPESISYIPDWADGATILSLALLCFLMIVLYPLLQPPSLIITGISLLLMMFGFNYWLWAYLHISLPLVITLLLIISVSIIYIIHNLLKETRDRQKIHEMFGQYVPVDHINKLINTPKKISTDGEKREMTVLFSDIRNFTSLSEPLTTRELKQFLNLYFTKITKIIFNKQGTIDKYMGDMIMAFWGAPLHNPKHANQAVLAALLIQKKISQMQDEFIQIGINGKISAGIGIHTGEMNVGDMGSEYRRAYTVLGDAVNLGSRLESLTKYYNLDILVSEKTKRECPDIIFRYIDNVRVKGKQGAIKIYEPIATCKTITKNQSIQLKNHKECMTKYLSGDWERASKNFQILFQDTQEPLYQLYIDRIKQLKSGELKNWDTVFTHNHK